MIDTDNGLGGPLNLFPPKGNAYDVDDGLAIILAVQSKRIEVEGITTVFGVSNPHDSRLVTEKLLKILNNDKIPVIEGARSKEELGKRTSASNFIIKKIMETDDNFTLCTLGPLTNIATAFKLEPKILKKINRIAIMGGFLPRDNFISRIFPSEFNFNLDLEASSFVLKKLQEEGISTIITDMNVCTQCTFSDKQISILKSVKNPLTQFVLDGVKNFYYFNKAINPFGKGFHPWDPISVASLIDTSIFKIRRGWVEVGHVNFGGFLKMGGIIKILKEKSKKFQRPLEFCTKINANRFLDLLMKALVGKKI
ncbi:MAG: nucleoside hydrolase [Candidatus Helarchaeota archaeon]